MPAACIVVPEAHVAVAGDFDVVVGGGTALPHVDPDALRARLRALGVPL